MPPPRHCEQGFTPGAAIRFCKFDIEVFLCYDTLMSKKEEVKSNIELLRGLIFTFLGALFGVCGFTFLQRKELDLYEFIFLAVVIVFLTSVICICGVLYNKQRQRLRDL